MDQSALNLLEVLVASLAFIAVVVLMRKRYDSNVPLLFYLVLVMFNNMSDRGTSPYLLYAGLILALLLRFEFMGGGFAKLVAFLTTATLGITIWMMMSEVFA